jgi:carbon monoxide dehydrogenase subunit G
MELQGDRLIPAPLATTWAALNDPDTLKACIAGCESLERTGDDAFAALVAVKVGPVSARFKGSLKLSNVVAPHSYTINFDGQGGVAGFGKGSADVALAEEGAQTRLKYQARAQVGGKMAQVGSRLIDAAASKVAEDFFKAFEARLSPPPAAVPVDTGQVPMPADEEKGNKALWWGIAALLAAALLYYLTR